MRKLASIAFFFFITLVLPAGVRPAEVGTLTTLYDFPQEVGVVTALVRAPNANFFGLTLSGGDPTHCSGGCGAAFALTPIGNAYAESTIFGWPSHSPVDPDGLFLDPSGTLYGTTFEGAVKVDGSVFKLVPSGKTFAQSTIFQFDGSDGSGPYGLLQGPNGTLIGTIKTGPGGNSLGAHFKLTPDGSGYKESILYAFKRQAVGGGPSALTTGPAGMFFGSTAFGGSNADLGIVYDLTPSQSGYTETTLLTFNFTNGAGPASNLTIDRAGNLFGTAGGGHCVGSMCFSSTGVAFELSPSKGGYVETLLHVFSSNEAYGPSSGLVPFRGALYGTTSGGGRSYKFGTIYKLVKSRGGYRETIVHAFTYNDGASPAHLFAGQDNALYGYTNVGGAFNAGTAFRFAP